MPKRLIIVTLALAACGKAADPPATGSAAQQPLPLVPSRAPALTDEGAKALLDKGTACKPEQGRLSMSCPEIKAIKAYAFNQQGDATVAATCAAMLRDPDTGKRFLAAECLDNLNSRGVTPVLGSALDAIEAETDPDVRTAIGWGIKGAEAVTAKQDDRVLALVTKYAAQKATADLAGYLFDTLFPQYLMAQGPKAPAKAQLLALASLREDDTVLQRRAFDAVRMLDDKPAVCAAIDADLTPTAKQWRLAVEAVAAMKDACVVHLAKTIDFVLGKLAGGDANLEVLRRYDEVFDLDAATRAKIVTSLIANRDKAAKWQHKRYDETIAVFKNPAVKKPANP